jgi:glutamine---fructose-6-phosphate transaminase (isomerizing)
MSFMEQEARQAPEAVARFLERNKSQLAELGSQLRKHPPPVIMTSARGSSDHAAGYFKYLEEILVGVPCASMGASVVSVYEAKLRVRDTLCLTISQSGQSPDIVALQSAARAAGAITVALVNVEDSPIARNANICLPLFAGPEHSVAATKSLIVSLAASAAIVAHWLNDERLISALSALPEKLEKACCIEWPELVELAQSAESFYVLGRGPSLPIAGETALKLKETCAIHAEAYSTAEVMHGPLELLGAGFPVMAFSPEDSSRHSSQEAILKMQRIGAKTLVVENGGLTYYKTGVPLFDPISMMQTTYLAIEKVARARGRDPDHPRLLKKITETL